VNVATKKKEAPKAAKPKVEEKAATPELTPKPVKVQEKVAAVFLKDAPKFGSKGEVRKMTEEAIAYINSQIKGAVKKK
jgi:hypothetical protein